MASVIRWEQAVGKKVRSSDDKDLGKIQTVTKDYIQTKDGTVSKNYYFIPKYYISGYDSDYIWVTITKDDAKSRFEKDKLPDLAEWETPAYMERRSQVDRDYPDFATNIPAYSSKSIAQAGSAANPSTKGIPISWDNVLDRKAKSSDGKDLGEVKTVEAEHIRLEEGTSNKKFYYIPKKLVDGFDGDRLFIGLTKDEVIEKFEHDNLSPSAV